MRSISQSNNHSSLVEAIQSALDSTDVTIRGLRIHLGALWYEYFAKSITGLRDLRPRAKEPPIGDAITYGILRINITLMLLARFTWAESGKQFKYRYAFIMYEVIGF